MIYDNVCYLHTCYFFLFGLDKGLGKNNHTTWVYVNVHDAMITKISVFAYNPKSSEDDTILLFII